MITITTGIQANKKDPLNKAMRCLADFRERGCYPGEDYDLAEEIVVMLIKRYGVKPFEVKTELRTESEAGYKFRKAQ